MCGSGEGRRGFAYGACMCGCCSCGCGGFRRRFISREEEIEMLKEYVECLKKEITGVEERIADLKS